MLFILQKARFSRIFQNWHTLCRDMDKPAKTVGAELNQEFQRRPEMNATQTTSIRNVVFGAALAILFSASCFLPIVAPAYAAPAQASQTSPAAVTLPLA
jgi:hypothetical protein